jgi:hypothetical protein
LARTSCRSPCCATTSRCTRASRRSAATSDAGDRHATA